MRNERYYAGARPQDKSAHPAGEEEFRHHFPRRRSVEDQMERRRHGEDAFGNAFRSAPVSYAGRGPKGYSRSDERIREDACEALTQHPDIDAFEVEVTVENGEITLKGTVSDRSMKRLAEETVEYVIGVKDVVNQLRLKDQPANRAA